MISYHPPQLARARDQVQARGRHVIRSTPTAVRPRPPLCVVPPLRPPRYPPTATTPHSQAPRAGGRPGTPPGTKATPHHHPFILSPQHARSSRHFASHTGCRVGWGLPLPAASDARRTAPHGRQARRAQARAAHVNRRAPGGNGRAEAIKKSRWGCWSSVPCRRRRSAWNSVRLSIRSGSSSDGPSHKPVGLVRSFFVSVSVSFTRGRGPSLPSPKLISLLLIVLRRPLPIASQLLLAGG